MGSEDKLDPDGIQSDGVPHYLADAARLQSYSDAREALSRFEVPVFIHADNPHEYLYVASFDGTGNDKYKDPAHETNVGKIDGRIQELRWAPGARISGDYVAGPGTQDEALTHVLDGMQGTTYNARIEEMYKKFIEQVERWKQADPEAQIRLADIGFSRGGEEAAGFARLVHERGIQDPAGAHYTYDRHHRITHVEYTLPPLVAPGKVPQAAVLLDPVGTGVPEQHHDRRLPPTVLAGVQVIAMDERRWMFKSDRIIDPGLTDGGRFLGLPVAGAHCNIGGCYLRNGLGIRSGNLAIDFMNALSDRPFLQREVEPDDPRLNVVHRSEYGSPLYFFPRVDRATRYGYNELLVPWGTEAQVPDPYNAEPRDEVLNAQFERQRVDTGLRPAPREVARAPNAALSLRLDRLIGAAKTDDWVTFSRENQLLGYGVAGRAMLEQAAQQANRLEPQALEPAAHHQAVQQQVETVLQQ